MQNLHRKPAFWICAGPCVIAVFFILVVSSGRLFSYGLERHPLIRNWFPIWEEQDTFNGDCFQLNGRINFQVLDSFTEADVEDGRLFTPGRLRVVERSKRLVARHLSIVIYYDDVSTRWNLIDFESAVLLGTVCQVLSFGAVGRNEVQADADHGLAQGIVDVPADEVINLEDNVEPGMLIGFEDDWNPLWRFLRRTSIQARWIAYKKPPEFPAFGNFRLDEVTSGRQVINFIDAIVVRFKLLSALGSRDANFSTGASLACFRVKL